MNKQIICIIIILLLMLIYINKDKLDYFNNEIINDIYTKDFITDNLKLTTKQKNKISLQNYLDEIKYENMYIDKINNEDIPSFNIEKVKKLILDNNNIINNISKSNISKQLDKIGINKNKIIHEINIITDYE